MATYLPKAIRPLWKEVKDVLNAKGITYDPERNVTNVTLTQAEWDAIRSTRPWAIVDPVEVIADEPESAPERPSPQSAPSPSPSPAKPKRKRGRPRKTPVEPEPEPSTASSGWTTSG
jgi:hypothetical protein